MKDFLGIRCEAMTTEKHPLHFPHEHSVPMADETVFLELQGTDPLLKQVSGMETQIES